MLNNSASNRSNSRTNLPIVEAETCKAGNPIVRIHDDLKHILLHIIEIILIRTVGESVSKFFLVVSLR